MKTELTTERLHLRRWRPGDAPALRRALDESDAHLRPWIPFMADEPRSLADTAARVLTYRDDFDAGLHYRFALWRGTPETLIGEVMLLGRALPGHLEVGYWLHPAHTRLGYGREALDALVRAGFAEPGITSLLFRCDRRNAPSNALPQRMGAEVIEVEEAGGLVPGEGNVLLNVWRLERDAFLGPPSTGRG